MDHQEEVRLERQHEPLAYAPDASDLEADDRLDRRDHGSQHERTLNVKPLEPAADDGRRQCLGVDDNVRKFRHRSRLVQILQPWQPRTERVSLESNFCMRPTALALIVSLAMLRASVAIAQQPSVADGSSAISPQPLSSAKDDGVLHLPVSLDRIRQG